MTDVVAISNGLAGALLDQTNDNSASKPSSHALPELPTELVELLYLLKLGVKTNLRWIGRETPDIDAARKTSARLCEYVDRLEALVAASHPARSEMQ